MAIFFLILKCWSPEFADTKIFSSRLCCLISFLVTGRVVHHIINIIEVTKSYGFNPSIEQKSVLNSPFYMTANK